MAPAVAAIAIYPFFTEWPKGKSRESSTRKAGLPCPAFLVAEFRIVKSSPGAAIKIALL
jgi:hypothetical protein